MVILVLPRLNAILYNICELMDSFFLFDRLALSLIRISCNNFFFIDV